MITRSLAALFLVLTAAVTTAQEEASELYRNAELGFELALPEGWVPHDFPTPGGKEIRFTRKPEVTVLFSVRVFPLSLAGSAEGGREMVAAQVQGQPDAFGGLTRYESTFQDEPVPALRVDVLQNQPPLHMQHVYLVHDTRFIVLQSVTSVEQVDEWMPRLDAILETLQILEVEIPVDPDAALKQLAKKCGTEIDWAESWEEAAARASKENKPIFVHAYIYPGFELSNDVMVTMFMEPDVVSLLNERYVCFELNKGERVPFEDHELYGLSDLTFGANLMITTPDGRVLAESGGLGYPFLVAGLDLESSLPGPAFSSDGLDGVELARRYLDRGELDRARVVLERAQSAEEFRLRADLHRRLFEGEEALADLVFAADAPGSEAIAADLFLDRALLLARLARPAQARADVEEFLQRFPDHPRTSEARYRRAELVQRLEGNEVAEAVYRELAQSDPDDRWAWRAAGVLTGTTFAIGQGFRIAWPERAAIVQITERELAPLSIEEVGRATEEAVGFLLSTQEPDGSWLHGGAAGEWDPEWPDDLEIAITAICGRALIEHRSTKGVPVAVGRSLEWVIAATSHALDHGDYSFFMDYSTWGWPYALSFFAACVEAGVADVEDLKPHADRMLASLTETQRTNGGWSYYLTADVQGDAAPANSISFTTAAAILGLLQAKDAGFDVPDEMLERALTCLEGMRHDNGAFAYMAMEGQGPARGNLSEPGASGRGPVCELALLRGGRAGEEEIQRAFTIFARHRDALAAEVGKVLMHCGSDGQGSHYPMFDYSTAAQAVAELPEKERARYRVVVLEELMRARSEGGAFQDNPMLGWNAGTGLALIAFTALR